MSPPLFNAWLHRYAILLAVCTLLLVVAGASVTSKEAGLSVPDWPLSYGQVMPPMTGGVFFEHGHRMIATTVGFLTIIMAVWIARVEHRGWMRKLGWISLAAVIIQGVLGGMTVLFLLPPAISVSHACLAQLFFCTTVALAMFTSRQWQEGAVLVKDHGWPSLRSLSILIPAMVLAQIALGAAFRHRAIGVMPHIIGAMVVTLAVLIYGVFVLHQFPEHRALRPTARNMLLVTFVQVFLGIVAYFVRMDSSSSSFSLVASTVTHVATGGLTLASVIALSIQIRRHVKPGAETAHSPRTAAVAS